ncbi:MAG: HEAT repeat domain-containing protein, partial [Candidatus Omnitrophica bacterium]|nr:HEAT repeat domain-containing protein [Candidatus Omnitrophota bacterium]
RANIDEIDEILIDEAGMPLVISGKSAGSTFIYGIADMLVAKGFLASGADYTVDESKRTVDIKEVGWIKIEKLMQRLSGNPDLKLFNPDESDENYRESAHLRNILAGAIDGAIQAHALFKLGDGYIIKDDKIVLVDEKGRPTPDRMLSKGLQQALQAKHGLTVTPENKEDASIAVQTFILGYDKSTGASGTAASEAVELSKIYKREVVVVPPNTESKRDDHGLVICRSQAAKEAAIITGITLKTEAGEDTVSLQGLAAIHATGRPVLVGTKSVGESETLAEILMKQGFKVSVLNAKNKDEEEAIIKEAGQAGAITIATNMAGRGTDIKLSDEAKALGGLHVVVTNGENVRQVGQLRGRAGRQGQAGSSADILSLDDELIRLYGGRERIEKIMDRLGVDTIDMAALARDHPQYARVINGIVNKNRQTIRDRGFDQRSNLVKFEEATSPYLGLFDQYKVNMESALNEDFDLLTDKAIADVVERESGVLDDENGAALFLYSLQLRFGIAFDPAKMVSEEYRGYFDWERYSSAMTADKTAFKRQLMEGVTESIKGKVARINAVISMLSDPTKGRKGLLRQLFAKTVNAARQDYVTAMADVKETIGLRSTAEKDPVQEYKKEAGSIYGEVNADIPVDFLGTLCRLTEFGQFETQLAAAMAVLSAAQPDKSDELLNKVAGLSDRELAELARTLGDEAAAEFAAEEDGRSAIRKLADYRINIRGKTLKVGAIAGASVAGFLQFGVGPVVSQVQTVVARSQAEEQIAKAMESWRKEAEAYQKYTASYTDAQKAFNDAKEKGDAREALKNIDIMLPILEHMNAINPNLPAKNLEQLKEIRAGLITSLFAELNAPAAGEALIAEVPVKEEPAAALAVAPKPAQPQIQPGSVWQSMKRGGAFATRMMLLGLTAAMVPAQQTPQVQPGAEKPAPAATSVTKEETSEERYTRESLNYPDAINSENYDEAFRILSVCIDIAARSAEEGKKGWGEVLTELRRRHAGLLELYAANRPDAYRALLVDSYGPLIAKYTTNRGLYIEASDAKKPDKAFDYAEICIANIKELRENGGWKIDPGLDKLITDWERLRTYQLDQKEKAAVAAVAPAAKPAVITVPALIEDLKDKDVAKRHAAVLALGVIGTKEAVLAIVTVSKDKEWIVRAAAAQALGHIGGEEALTILPQLSKDEDAEV